MTDNHIYVRFKGKTLGPLSLQKARDLVRRGQITRMHELSTDGVSWMRGEEFGSLFQSSRPTVAERETLVAGSEIPSGVVSESRGTGPDGPNPQRPEPTDSKRVETVEPSVQWYAHIDGENRGPLDKRAVQSAIEEGKITGDTLVWRAGFDDWKRASECFSRKIGKRPDPMVDLGDSQTRTMTHPPGSSSQSELDLHYELQQHRPWVMFFSIGIMLTAILNAVTCIAYMVVGASSPTTGSAKVVIGLTGLTLAVLLMTGGWLFWRYANALKDIAIHRNDRTPAEAARRMKVFLKYVGITSLALSGLTLFAGIVLMAMAAGAGAGALNP